MILTALQKTEATLVITDAKGNPAQIDGTPEWASSDPNVASVTASADGMSATVVAGATGTTQISVTVDALIGEGVEAVVGLGDIEVIAGQASVVALQFAPPSAQ